MSNDASVSSARGEAHKFPVSAPRRSYFQMKAGLFPH